MGRRYDTISFLSDYGTDDESAGVVRAVIRDLAPHAHVVDLTHSIPPFDVRAGSLALARAIGFVPTGVVLAIVDPAVGTSRRAIAVEVADGAGVIVGPDNGLLAPAVSMAGGSGRTVILSNADFHLGSPGFTSAGRDVFAPVAAHLCNGVDLAELGDVIDAEALMPGVVPLPREDGGAIVCEVLWVDRFGNCQLNVGPDDLDAWVRTTGDRVRIVTGEAANGTQTGEPMVRIASLQRTFAEVGAGAVGLVLDPHGLFALVLDRRSAADELGLGAGSQVAIEAIGDSGTPPASITTAVASPGLRRPSAGADQ